MIPLQIRTNSIETAMWEAWEEKQPKFAPMNDVDNRTLMLFPGLTDIDNLKIQILPDNEEI